MSVRIVNPLTDDVWDEHIAQFNSELPIFYTSTWAKVLAASYGYMPLYFTISDENGIKAFLPVMEVKSSLTGKRGVALPFTDFCEPQFKTIEQSRELLDSILSHGKSKNWNYFELRGGNRHLTKKPNSETYIEHQIDLLPDTDEILQNIRSSFKRNVKKSVQNEVQIEISQSRKALKHFIYLNFLTRKRHGLPPQPSFFFKNLYRYCIKEKGYIFLARYAEQIIAGAIFLVNQGNVIYKYGASDIEYQSLRPNNQLMWEAVKFFKEMDCKSISLGRTHPDHTGLIQFKNGLTKKTQTVDYYRFNFVKGSPMEVKQTHAKYFTRIFNKMPIPILNLTGKLLYRHMG